jgi:hypothetical protein
MEIVAVMIWPKSRMARERGARARWSVNREGLYAGMRGGGASCAY